MNEYTVAQLNRAVARTLDGMAGRNPISVRGEIAHVSIRYHDGWPRAFFSLLEGDEVLSCISMGYGMEHLLTVDQQTGEYFSPPRKPEDVIVEARQVICEGKLTTYSKRSGSRYQLSVSSITDVGAGALQRRLRLLQEKLEREGLFSPERKRPIPPNPSRVALITSTQGAAIHDFLQNAQNRGMGAVITVYAVRVQGDGAADDIVQALARANADMRNEVIVLIRGGGSAEDLSCFNNESLARTIAASRLPVVVGVGHETDFTFADMTADRRVSTPTKAAQELWQDRRDIRNSVAALLTRGERSFRLQLAGRQGALENLGSRLRLLSPVRQGRIRRMELAEAARDAEQAYAAFLARFRETVSDLHDRAEDMLAPFVSASSHELRLQASSVRQAAGALVGRKAAETGQYWNRVNAGMSSLLRVAETEAGRLAGDLAMEGRRFCGAWEERLDALVLRLEAASPKRRASRERPRELEGLQVRLSRALSALLRRENAECARAACSLARSGRRLVRVWEERLEALASRLESANPLRQLSNGFAFVSTEKGEPVRSAASVLCGQRLHLTLLDGTVTVTVNSVAGNGSSGKPLPNAP